MNAPEKRPTKLSQVSEQGRVAPPSSSEQVRGPNEASPHHPELLSLLRSIQSSQLEHSSKLSAITAWISERSAVVDEETQDIAIPRTLDAFKRFDNSVMKSKELQKKLKARWKSLGGVSLSDTVRRIMRDMLSDEVGTNYSWQGNKGKLHFNKTACCKILLEVSATAARIHGATSSDVEQIIKTWLRHSKERLTKKKETSMSEEN